MYKFATTNSNFEKKTVISDTHLRITYTCISIFSNIVLASISVKTVHTNFMQLPIVILKKHASSYNEDVYKFSAKSG